VGIGKTWSAPHPDGVALLIRPRQEWHQWDIQLGQGKRGGYRVIVLDKIGTRVVCVHGLAKSDEDSITPAQAEPFKDLSRIYLGLSDKALKTLVVPKEFTEVQGYEKETEAPQRY